MVKIKKHRFMNLKKMYNYLYYKLYKLADSSIFAFWSEWKAYILISLLDLILILSTFIYYNIFINRYINIDSNIPVYALVGIVGFINYMIFYSRDQWKKIVKDFDKLPKKKNIIGGVIVYTFIILVFANLVFSFYLMSQIDWSLYK